MVLSFKDGKDEREFNQDRYLKRRWGQQADKIKLRLTQLKAAENLSVLRPLPQCRAHELIGNRKGQISIDLNHPYRLIVAPDHNPIPVKEDGGLNWDKVTKIIILKVEDTHG